MATGLLTSTLLPAELLLRNSGGSKRWLEQREGGARECFAHLLGETGHLRPVERDTVKRAWAAAKQAESNPHPT